MGKSGLIKNADLASWHSHNLRQSFETEDSHAGAKAEIRDYFMRHKAGIQLVYDHLDQVHPEDLVKEYLKIEPYVSPDPTETNLRHEFESRDSAIGQGVRGDEVALP